MVSQAGLETRNHGRGRGCRSFSAFWLSVTGPVRGRAQRLAAGVLQGARRSSRRGHRSKVFLASEGLDLDAFWEDRLRAKKPFGLCSQSTEESSFRFPSKLAALGALQESFSEDEQLMLVLCPCMLNQPRGKLAPGIYRGSSETFSF